VTSFALHQAWATTLSFELVLESVLTSVADSSAPVLALQSIALSLTSDPAQAGK